MIPAMPSRASFHVQLQDRDLSLLKGLFESRIMTLKQATAIHFAGSAEACKKRVQKLKAAGFIAERPRRAYDPSILFLTRKSFNALAEGGHLDDYPSLIWTDLERRARVSQLTLRHELDVMDFRASVYTAVARVPALSIVEFSTWPLLYEFQGSPGAWMQSMAVRPDGFIHLHETHPGGVASERLFFLEVDRSTEVLDTLMTRSQCYRDYYRRGGLATRYGHPRSDFELFPFRVLIIVRNAERRNNMAERLLLLRPPILSQVWLTTFPEAIADPLGGIWMNPRQYRAAVAGTPFSAFQHDEAIYRRSIEREAAIDSRLQKQPLFYISASAASKHFQRERPNNQKE
jgi:hypothetical protein